jgi:G protein-coupled receptor 158
MIVAVLCYLAAFTASCMDFLNYTELFELGLCKFRSIDYVTQCGELLILGFGLQIAFVSRNANTQFRVSTVIILIVCWRYFNHSALQERQFLVASISIELIVSSIFYILKAVYLDDFNPSALLLALFIRSQLTNSITLGLVFAPKLWYQHKQVSTNRLSLGVSVVSWFLNLSFPFYIWQKHLGFCKNSCFDVLSFCLSV